MDRLLARAAVALAALICACAITARTLRDFLEHTEGQS